MDVLDSRRRVELEFSTPHSEQSFHGAKILLINILVLAEFSSMVLISLSPAEVRP